MVVSFARFFLVLAVVLFPGASARAVVKGLDNRQTANFETVPSRFIGKIGPPERVCTGTLVGPAHVLTAAHCLSERDNGNFYFRYSQSSAVETIKVVYVYRGAFIPLVDNKWFFDNGISDYAIAILAKNIGDTYGWLQMAPKGPVLGEKLILSGYSGDWLVGGRLSPSFDSASFEGSQCVVHKHHTERILEHGCDMTPGASGAALVAKSGKEHIIVGMNAGENIHDKTNFALGCDLIYPTWVQARNEYDQKKVGAGLLSEQNPVDPAQAVANLLSRILDEEIEIYFKENPNFPNMAATKIKMREQLRASNEQLKDLVKSNLNPKNAQDANVNQNVIERSDLIRLAIKAAVRRWAEQNKY